MKTVCPNCKKEHYDKTKWCELCLQKRRDKTKANLSGYYYVYALPSTNPIYVGITNNIDARLYRHSKILERDITNARVLYSSTNLVEALYHEALFQSVLGCDGISTQGYTTSKKELD